MQQTQQNQREQLLAKANTLPMTPGVYIMRDPSGRVIYVGKSKKLHNRVSQYFQNSEKNPKTAMMVASVADFDFILCQTEIEALSLENTLIKQYSPHYNIRLKDAKSYPYVKVTQEEYPRLLVTRKRLSDKALYFGPYTGASTAYAVLGVLRKTFGLPTCSRKFPGDIGRARPCLYYQMNRCCGLCSGDVTADAYRNLVQNAVCVLRGETHKVKQDLTAQMQAFAEAEQYEAAAKCRDAIRSLDALSEKQFVVASPDVTRDVFALYDTGPVSVLSAFFVRGGVVTDKADYVLGTTAVTDDDSIVAFLCELYRRRDVIPRVIDLSFNLDEDERELLASFLSTQAEHRVEIDSPSRGDRRALCETVLRNAQETARRQQTQEEDTQDVLFTLADLLQLECYPTRIESYDVSNLGAEHVTGGMIVYEDGKPKKSEYRLFRIKTTAGIDDYGAMYEMLDRRFAHIEKNDGAFGAAPDLILLDGGKTHVATVKNCLAAHQLAIPVFGLVKDDKHRTRAICTESEEIDIAEYRDLFVFLYKMQEEVHRYTVSRMESAKQKTLVRSTLENVPGIGKRKASVLLAAMGGLAGVRRATAEQLAAVKGITQKDALAIAAYFEAHRQGKK